MNGGERFARADALFKRALREAPGERERVVREGAGEDRALAEEVLELLAQDEASGGYLETPAVAGGRARRSRGRPRYRGSGSWACWARAGWGSCIAPSRNGRGGRWRSS